MIAKKVFLFIVVLGSVYLGYQMFGPFDIKATPNTVLQDDSSHITVNDSLEDLQRRLSQLEQQYVELNDAIVEMESTESDSVMMPNSSTESTSLEMGQAFMTEPSSNLGQDITAQISDMKAQTMSSSSVNKTLSERDRRLKQQAELRALADKHQIDALTALSR